MKFSSRLAALLISSLAFSASAAHAQTAVPFNGTFNIDESLALSPDAGCPILTGIISGQGTATHLGRTAISGTNCVTPPAEGAPPVYNFANGKIILMAANGDTLNGTFSGSFVPTGKGTVFTVVDGTYSFSRGTGRFAAATGTGKLTGTQDIATGKGKLQATGTISY
ncbi:MAG: hypothetical protein JWM30_1350 [Burkholderia sp.]|nr:hypothetical protein [Burkholderia sp.]